jgi:aminomethyltransferase
MSSRSHLHERHVALGARFVDFGGWDMPIQYESVLAEHRAVREAVGVFDVSHLGRLSVAGPGATDALRSLFTNDVARYEPGRTHYTMLLDEGGGIVDDIVVWRWEEDFYWVMPNAANAPIVRHAIEEAGRAEVGDLRPETVLLAVQGPEAPGMIEEILGEAPRRFRTLVAGEVRAAGTGYTGEVGGELCVPAAAAGEVFDRILAAGAVPCGLGARDTLRLEAGLALWGSDIDTTTTPLEAGLDFAVDWDHDFVGREALLRQREQGVRRRLTGLVMEGRGIPRHGYRVRSGDSTGTVTSGNISPVLDTGIALAYMSPPVSVGEAAEVEVRERWIPGRIENPPFHR